MKYVDHQYGKFVDRKNEESGLEPIDVVMATLDAESFLEKCLYSVFKEIPIRKLFICDGGSHDNTQNILKNFPRTEVFVKPEIRTTGKVIEFLISQVETNWFLIIDADIELELGWYDEMRKYENKYDVLENGMRLNAFHFYREQKIKPEKDKRALNFCHLARKSAVKKIHCDDDYMWRFTDIFFRQEIENSGFTYGKINSTQHIHNETERIQYESDSEKNFTEVKFKIPETVITNKEKFEFFRIKHAKAVIKYLDPEFPMVKKDKSYDDYMSLLERKWVEENGPKWLPRFDKSLSKNSIIKRSIRKKLKKFKPL